MSITFGVVREDKIDLADELIEEFRTEARAVVREGVDLYVAKIKRNLTRISGRVSQEGETPARQSGELERSFKRGSIRLGRDKASISGTIDSTEPWEKINGLEYGATGPDGRRLLPRPYLRPAEQAVEPKIEKLFEERL